MIAMVLVLGLLADPLEPIGRISDPTILETSGIVASRKHRGIFWIQSDSGNPPAIHAIRRDGRVVASFRVGIPNIDWEDIATDDSGHLYLAETGNNGALLPIRAIYQIDEPDPFGPKTAASLPVTQRVVYRFDKSTPPFDAESLFVVGRRAFVIDKRHDKADPSIFRFDLDAPSSLLQPALPKPVGKLPGFPEPATAADLSRDGKWLAVAALKVTRVYRSEAGGGLTLVATVRYKERQIEAIGWDGLDLILATEDGDLFRIEATTWKESGKARP